jgi:hypothetical protein
LKSPAAPAAGTVQQPITVNAWERLNVPFPLLDKTVTYPAKLLAAISGLPSLLDATVD